VETLTAVLAVLVAVAILYFVANRIGVPYPALFVLGGIALGFIPGGPHLRLEPELVLLVFLPPLLFIAATETPIRELRANIVPIGRLAFGLVFVTILAVAAVAQVMVPGIPVAAAFTLGAIVAPTDALAATTVFRRLGVPRIVQTLIEGEALFNDATALVAYRAGIAAVVAASGLVLVDQAANFGLAVVGGIAIGLVIGWLGAHLLHRLDEPTVEVVLSFVIPYAAYLPADAIGVSGVLAAVTAGLIIGSRLGRVLTARSRVLWLGSWKIVGFVLNGFAFVLIGLELPAIGEALRDRPIQNVVAVVAVICLVVVLVRFLWVFVTSYARNSPYRQLSRTNVVFARRMRFIVAWSGLRGAVSLAAALALPPGFPERELILLTTLVVIMVTLVGQGVTLPWLVRRARRDAPNLDGDEETTARQVAYQAGLDELDRQREAWSDHQPLLDRLASGLRDRSEHLATDDPDETAERRQERIEHEQIQLAVIAAQRMAVIDLRDSGQINDETLRVIERELDFEEIRMEG
jgi:CPA1 family monovalent cation:H+ antiporter